MNPYKLLMTLAGFSLGDAAIFHNVPLDVVESWVSGRDVAPKEAVAKIRKLISAQEKAAIGAIAWMAELESNNGTPGVVELGYPSDDREAIILGFPTVSAWAAVAARVIAAVDIPIRLVPRGSTPSTALAAAAHGRPVETASRAA